MITEKISTSLGTLYLEDPSELRDLLDALRAEYQPSGPAEEFFIEQMACAQSSIRRYRRTLTGLLDYQTAIAAERLNLERRQDTARSDAGIHAQNTLLLGAAFHLDCRDERAQLGLHRALMDLDRAYHRALKSLEAAQARRAKRTASSTAEQAEQAEQAEPAEVAVAPAVAPAAAPAVSSTPAASQFVTAQSTPVKSRSIPNRPSALRGTEAPPGTRHAT